MIARDSLILHCAFTEYRGRAILFSAPSGTGKPTQAALWERYRGSRTVNGDRALLRRAGGVWTACGWPVCGSSEICGAGEVPIGAIVMLRQGEGEPGRAARARARLLAALCAGDGQSMKSGVHPAGHGAVGGADRADARRAVDLRHGGGRRPLPGGTALPARGVSGWRTADICAEIGRSR